MGAWRVTSQSDALGEKSLRIDPAPEELGIFLKRLLIEEEWRLGTECWRERHRGGHPEESQGDWSDRTRTRNTGHMDPVFTLRVCPPPPICLHTLGKALKAVLY